jgi:hypothetical protein
MKKFFLLGVLLCTMSMMVFAQDGEQKDQAQMKSMDITALQLGNQLAKYGYQTQSAASLTEAARILSMVQTQAMKDKPTDRGAAPSSTDAKSATSDYDPWTLIADARKIAANDPHMLALIDQQEKAMKAQDAANRGRVGGPACETSTVSANSYVIYTVSFKAGELAECLVAGDGDTDLDLYVYDQNNNLITKDIDYTDVCYASWVPRWTGSFKLKIVNRGGVYNRYRICVN